MPLWSRRWPFVAYSVEAAPLDAGVFALWKAGEVVYIGSSDGPRSSIRTELTKHFREHPDETSRPDHYSWEVADDPPRRKAEMLELFRANHGGRLPILNKSGT